MKASEANQAAPCDLCGGASARRLYEATDRLGRSDQPFSIVECSGCNVLRTMPPMTDGELEPFYPDDYWGEAEPPDERWIRESQAEKVAFLNRCRLSSGRILDVGCGSGLFLRALDGRNWERQGVETGARAAQAARRAIGESSVFHGTLIEARFDGSSFDVVTLWSSLEHMNEPRENLVEARRILKHGGTVIVQVPNAASYQARVFGGQWFALDAPRHRYHFTLRSLSRLLSEAGFEVYGTSFFSRAHNSHALRQSLKTRLRAGESALGYIVFCLSIPMIKPVDLVMSAAGSGATLTIAARAV